MITAIWVVLSIIAVWMVATLAQHIYDRVIDKRNSQIEIITESGHWERRKWGQGMDLSDLLPSKAIEAPDFASVLADTTWAKVEAEWEKEHPTVETELRAEVAAQKKLIEQKSKRIQMLQAENESYKRSLGLIPSEYDYTYDAWLSRKQKYDKVF